MRWDFRQIIDAEPDDLSEDRSEAESHCDLARLVATLSSAKALPARLESSGAEDVTVVERSHTEDSTLVRVRATLRFDVDAPQPCPSSGRSHGCEWTETWLSRADSDLAFGAIVVHIERIPAVIWGRVRLSPAGPGRTQVWLTLDAEPCSPIVGLEATEAAGRAVFEIIRQEIAQLAAPVQTRTLATMR